MTRDPDQQRSDKRHSLEPAPRAYAPGVRLIARRIIQPDLDPPVSHEEIERWLLGPASKLACAHALMEGFVSRLARAGLGVDRMSMNVGTLHPQAYGYAWSWNRLDGICDEIQIGQETMVTDQYRRNPIFRVIEFGEAVRVRLPATGDAQSPLMSELAAAGYTEYNAIPLSASGEKYNAVTLTTRQDGGFTKAQWDILMRLLDIFALQVEKHIVSRIAENISHTYLGREAGERVVSGTIRRGSGVSIRAIVWSSDMRGFSTLSERRDNRAVADLLNSYFSVLAEAVIRNGGDVLKFVGDGMLAVFPISDFPSPEAAAKAAADAAREAVHELDALNSQMEGEAGWIPLKTGIGLHLGEVFFGNIGAPRRLDFTVIGEAVNIASRIEGLCKPLGHTILMSETVANLVGAGTEPLGLQHLQGIEKPEQLFTLPV